MILGTLLSYIVPLVLNCKDLSWLKVITGSLVLLCMLPTYINIFVIYAISNLHDISWGNRPTTAKVSKKQVDLKISYEVFRSRCLVAFILANVAFAYIVIYLSRSN